MNRFPKALHLLGRARQQREDLCSAQSMLPNGTDLTNATSTSSARLRIDSTIAPESHSIVHPRRARRCAGRFSACRLCSRNALLFVQT